MTREAVGPASDGGVRVERVSGPDGGGGAEGRAGGPSDESGAQTWVVGDDEECVVIDAGRAAGPVLEAVAGRRLTAVLCTQARREQVAAVADLLEAQPRMRIGVHADDLALWHESHPHLWPSLLLADGDTITVGDIELTVIHASGPTPGSCCFYSPHLGAVFTGDVAADEPLRHLDADTLVHPAHGPSTTIAEARRRLGS